MERFLTPFRSVNRQTIVDNFELIAIFRKKDIRTSNLEVITVCLPGSLKPDSD